MRWLALLLRIVGWLLTPFMVWAASFLGAWVGAGMFRNLESPRDALYYTAASGLITGLVATFFWLRFLRKSPRLRHSLHVTREGLPVLEEALPPAEPEVVEVPGPPARQEE